MKLALLFIDRYFGPRTPGGIRALVAFRPCTRCTTMYTRRIVHGDAATANTPIGLSIGSSSDTRNSKPRNFGGRRQAAALTCHCSPTDCSARTLLRGILFIAYNCILFSRLKPGGVGGRCQSQCAAILQEVLPGLVAREDGDHAERAVPRPCATVEGKSECAP